MELFKKIYYPKKYRIGKLICLPIMLIILLLLVFQMAFAEYEDVETKLINGALFSIIIFALIFLFFITINPVLTFSSDSVYFHKHRILFGEIEKIQISKTGKILLFSLRRERNKAWLIDCEQLLFDPQVLRLIPIEDRKWMAAHKGSHNIFLYNILGFDTPLEEILSCFPQNIPIIEDKD